MSLTRVLAVCGALLALAGCGNQTDQGKFLKTLSSGGLKKDGQGTAATPEQVQAEIANALKSSDLPLALAVVEARNATSILTRIETNGAHGTWATPDRRTVTMRGGFVTATRGLGNDIMSSDTGAVAALVKARKPGNARRVMRYLDGENHTVEIASDCTVSRGGTKQIVAGEIKARTVTMLESCQAGGLRFDNFYQVDSRGYPVLSRQWLGPAGGYLLIQTLRK